LLGGRNVNLRLLEKEDLPLLTDWYNNPDFTGDFVWLPQNSRMEREKWYDSFTSDVKFFFIERKDGVKVGTISHFPAENKLAMEIGYILAPDERGKGYCTEAVTIMVDYLFLSKSIVRVQAYTVTENMGSQKVLEKAGFSKEGILRKSSFRRGEWRDNIVFSILREEWKEPKILAKHF
jgi:ribosomal-protein-alanine N-acetyltransferase